MENGLEIGAALRPCKEVRLFGASSPVPNQAYYVFQDLSIIRDVREAGWVDDLNEAIEKHNIDLVYPANSLVIDRLVEERARVKAPVLLPDNDIIRLTRSKKATLRALEGALPLPRIYKAPNEILSYPAFAKPDAGYGSQGAEPVETPEQAQKIDFDRFVVQEHLPGREYTVDCFSDSNGKLLFSGARERGRVRMGTSMHAESAPPELEEKLRAYAEAILTRIRLSGAWFFQMKEDAQGVLKLLEIDVRIAGTMCFNRARGINFPLLSILQFQGKEVSVMINDCAITLDRCLRNRYLIDCAYDAVYVDLDDTIIVRDRLNLEMIQFLFQCVNKNKKIILLTKFLGDRDALRSYLKRWRIEGLFDEIVHVREEESKADAITLKNAILIDDSFTQRREAAQKLGIPTFDPSMIEALLDDRI